MPCPFRVRRSSRSSVETNGSSEAVNVENNQHRRHSIEDCSSGECECSFHSSVLAFWDKYNQLQEGVYLVHCAMMEIADQPHKAIKAITKVKSLQRQLEMLQPLLTEIESVGGELCMQMDDFVTVQDLIKWGKQHSTLSQVLSIWEMQIDGITSENKSSGQASCPSCKAKMMDGEFEIVLANKVHIGDKRV